MARWHTSETKQINTQSSCSLLFKEVFLYDVNILKECISKAVTTHDGLNVK